MKIVISILLNIVLAGALWFLVNQPRSIAPPEPKLVSAPIASKPIEKQIQTPLRTGFSWSMVESGDPSVLAASLRAIQCPEAVIRDIVVARVNRSFAAKRMSDGGKPFDWNPPVPSGYSRKEEVNPMRSFEPARRAEIARILGENWDADLRYLSEADRAILSFLPVEKRIAAWKAANHIPWGKAVAKPAAALSRVLSPEELNEITLRTSDTATDLRQNLIGFEPTEEEFHTIVRLREVGSSAKSPEDAARAESDLKTALGEARYAEFLRARDPVFKAAYIFARHYGMPITSAAQAYSAAKASEAGAARIRSDANLSPEEKQTAIAGNSKLLESTLSATLGKPCSDALRWFAHSWFEALDSVTASGDGLK